MEYYERTATLRSQSDPATHPPLPGQPLLAHGSRFLSKLLPPAGTVSALSTKHPFVL